MIFASLLLSHLVCYFCWGLFILLCWCFVGASFWFGGRVVVLCLPLCWLLVPGSGSASFAPFLLLFLSCGLLLSVGSSVWLAIRIWGVLLFWTGIITLLLAMSYVFNFPRLLIFFCDVLLGHPYGSVVKRLFCVFFYAGCWFLDVVLHLFLLYFIIGLII